MASGIYAIVNCTNGKMYVGSAVDIERRRIKHFSRLRCGTHPSAHLQASWNKHGAPAFLFKVLEECAAERETLLNREQTWMDTLRPEYNKRLVADSNIGLPHSPEHKAFIGACVRAWRQTPDGKLHKGKLAAANKQSWATPNKREARVAAIKESWTPEKRAEASQASKQRSSHILADGTHFGTKRVWTEEEKLRSGAKLVEAWKKRAPVSEAEIRELVTKTNSAWEAKELTGVRSMDRVLIHCSQHNHEQWQTIAKLKYHQRGCKFCGYSRSSEVQKGRPKSPFKEK